MGPLLEAIGIVLETHFGFGLPNGSPVGDSLMREACMHARTWAQDKANRKIFERNHLSIFQGAKRIGMLT